MEREDVINNIKSSISGKNNAGFKEFENWFYATSVDGSTKPGIFAVDLGFLKIDCFAISVDKDHVCLRANELGDAKEQYVFPIFMLGKFNVVWF